MGCYKACFTCEHLDTGRGKEKDGLIEYRCKRWSKWTSLMFWCEAYESKGQKEFYGKLAEALRKDGEG